MDNNSYLTYVEIDLSKLQDNLKAVREIIGNDCRIMSVLKADAYGHGITMCSKYAEPFADWFAVVKMDEANKIRSNGSAKPVLLLGTLSENEIADAVEKNITVSIISYNYAEYLELQLEKLGLHLNCHIEVDTGLNRTGIAAREGRIEDAAGRIEGLFRKRHLHVTGIFTHFSCGDSEEPVDKAYTEKQFAVFWELIQKLCAKGYDVGLRHCLSTGPLLAHPEWKLDMVRTGMMTFGQCISERETLRLGLKPVLRWYAKIVDLRTVKAGEYVGYDRLYRVIRDSRIATVSVGYADGYNRSYSNHARVVINGKTVPVCGKISMDYTTVDVTDIESVKTGDTVLLLGAEGENWISCDFLSELVRYGVNGWVTTMISGSVPRIYYYNNEIVEG